MLLALTVACGTWVVDYPGRVRVPGGNPGGPPVTSADAVLVVTGEPGDPLAAQTLAFASGVLAIGAPDAGAVYLVDPSLTGTVDAAAADVRAAPVAQRPGAALAAHEDGLLVGAPGGPGGTVYLVPVTGSGPLATTASMVLESDDGGALGTSVAAGDYDGDGDEDVGAGEPGGRGNAYVVFGLGGVVEPDEEADVRVRGAQEYEGFGASLALADVDGDGRADLVGCGSTCWVVPGPTLVPDRPADEVDVGSIGGGAVLFDASDLDEDGREDLVLGVPDQVVVFFGPVSGAHLLADADAVLDGAGIGHAAAAAADLWLGGAGAVHAVEPDDGVVPDDVIATYAGPADFGAAVAVDASRLAVSAPGDLGGDGSVRVFTLD